MRKDRQEKNENIITIQIEKRRKAELSYEGMKIDSRERLGRVVSYKNIQNGVVMMCGVGVKSSITSVI